MSLELDEEIYEAFQRALYHKLQGELAEWREQKKIAYSLLKKDQENVSEG